MIRSKILSLLAFPCVLSVLVLSMCCSPVAFSPGWERTADPDAIHGRSLLDHTVKLTDYVMVLSAERPEIGFSSVWTGSGVVVATSGGKSLVITAKHVCSQKKKFREVPGQLVSERLEVTGIDGVVHESSVILMDEKEDICAVVVTGICGTPVAIGDDLPVGGHVYHTGAPTGTFGRQLGFIVEGYYGGVEKVEGREFEALSVSTTQGSSGGPIFYHDALVGILVMVNRDGGSSSWAITLGTVRRLIRMIPQDWHT